MPRKNKNKDTPRRHHNTDGRRQLKSGASFRRLVMFARRHGMKVEGEREVEQLKE